MYGQGHVAFRTHTSPDDRVRWGDGTLVAGVYGFRAELIYASDGTPADQFSSVAVRLGNDAAVGVPTPGAIVGGARTALITRDAAGNPAPGGFALFQVRVWNPAQGATYNIVLSMHPAPCTAESPIMRVDTGNHLAPQPELPAELPLPSVAGFGGLIIYNGSPSHPDMCVPEPSIVGLGLLAAGALLLRRRA